MFAKYFVRSEVYNNILIAKLLWFMM